MKSPSSSDRLIMYMYCRSYLAISKDCSIVSCQDTKNIKFNEMLGIHAHVIHSFVIIRYIAWYSQLSLISLNSIPLKQYNLSLF